MACQTDRHENTIYQTGGGTRIIYMQTLQRCVEKAAYPIFEGAKLNFVQMSNPSDGPCTRKFFLQRLQHGKQNNLPLGIKIQILQETI